MPEIRRIVIPVSEAVFDDLRTTGAFTMTYHKKWCGEETLTYTLTPSVDIIYVSDERIA